MRKPKIIYLAHDLADAAVHKRVAMLRDGGAILSVAGFRRTPQPVRDVAGHVPVDLGRTYDGRFVRRIAATLRYILLPLRNAAFAEADVIVARNLEMLAIGARHAAIFPATTLVYESLDIHRLLFDKGPTGRLLRRIEELLVKKATALITSSPGFIAAHFSRHATPVRLIENKVYDPQGKIPAQNAWPKRPAGPPWKIGWFGVIRCRKSLMILSDLARRSNGAVEIVIRGRPALDQIPDFQDVVSRTRGMHFTGAYRYPEDLPALYRSIHFSWAVDFYEEDGNSSLLLPNRLYEGGLFDAVPVALKSVFTGVFLDQIGAGVTLEDPLRLSLPRFFDTLTADRYRALEERATQTPRAQWRHDEDDCRSLVGYLASLSHSPGEPVHA
ncbi:MAG: glycosyl transferase family 1 [Alphaproteobacteria bacterium]|nr:glycosyl transferase family 1 [Alphaproteobacteria bacterium]